MTDQQILELQALMLQQHVRIVVIGASAGAVDALSAILPAITDKSSLTVIIVIHIPTDRESVLPELFRRQCTAHVYEAEDKEPLLPGTIYFAPPNYHLLVESNETLSLSSEELVLYSRPSINVLFESAAEALGNQVLGIILTGANEDGAHGLQCIYEAGGLAIVQHPEYSEVPHMPQAALKRCPDAAVLKLEEIRALLKLFGGLR